VSTKRAVALTPVVAVTGDDDAMIAGEVRLVLEELLGDRDAGLVVEEVAGLGGEELDVGAVIDAYTTPPFLVDRRIVVVRDAGRLDKDGAARLAAALDPPPPDAALVLVKGSKAIPASLLKKVAALGRVVDVSIRKAAAKREFVTEHLRHGSVRLSAGAQKQLEAHLGEELGRLDGILDTLAAAYGEGVTVDEEMLTPFLGSKGAVPIFDLTDALEAGNIAAALGIIDRMMGPGGVSGHEILASIDNHLTRAARLQGAPVRSGEDAAAILKIHAFPAKKALNLARRLELDRLSECLGLVAQADLDLKGMSGLDERLVIEILVARLTRALGARRG
jgi:DNA polymerase-3 subunit delta